MTAAVNPLSDLHAIHRGTGEVNVIVETPRGSRNKIKLDPPTGMFRLDKTLPAGAVFPYDFGFFPATEGEDGDPLDALILMDEQTFPGILVRARLVGVIEAEQTANGTTIRNDRLIAVASASQDRSHVHRLDDVDESLLAQIEYFFISYNQAEGRDFRPIRRAGPATARALLNAGARRYEAHGATDTP